jgi:hypothetical protein
MRISRLFKQLLWWSSQALQKRHSPAAFRTCRNAGNSVLTAEGTTSKGTGSISCEVEFCMFYRLRLRTLWTKDVGSTLHCQWKIMWLINWEQSRRRWLWPMFKHSSCIFFVIWQSSSMLAHITVSVRNSWSTAQTYYTAQCHNTTAFHQSHISYCATASVQWSTVKKFSKVHI